MKLSRTFATAFLVVALISGYAIAASNDTYGGFPVVLVKVNGKLVQSDVPAINFNGRTMLPIRAVADALGAEVGWDQATQTASVDLTSTVEVQRKLGEANTKITQLTQVVSESRASSTEVQRKLDQANAQIIQLTQTASNDLTGSATLQQQLKQANARVAQLEGEVAALKNPPAPRQETLTYSDGSKYVGYVLDDGPHGQGTLTYADGSKYVGEWIQGKWHGQGTITFTGGGKYEGQWKDGQWHGLGTATYTDGGKYEGEWQASKQHGLGTYTWADGSKYIGQWKDGAWEGLGVYQSADGGIVGQLRTDGVLTSTEQPLVTVTTADSLDPASIPKGSILVADDGTYLGEVTGNEYASKSICNEYGAHGSEYRTDSIWNEYGTHGSDYSTASAFNDLARKPPMIISDGKLFAYLTTNTAKHPRVSPFGICEQLERAGK